MPLFRHASYRVMRLCVYSVLSLAGAQHAFANSQTALPKSGLSMQQVTTQFGQPVAKQPRIGTPPITVWRYADFNVYFERQTVVHSVRFVPLVKDVTVIIE